MCWNAEVSLLTWVASWGVGYYLFQRKYSTRDEFFSIILVSFSTIQLCEFLMWISIPEEGQEPCPLLNQVATGTASFVLYMEPVMFNLAAFLYQGREFAIIMWTSVIQLLAILWMMIQQAPTMCTRPGPNGVLVWDFGLVASINFPNAFSYFVTLLLPLLFIRPRYTGLSLLGIGTCNLMLPRLLYGTAEWKSLWCFSSCFAGLYMLLEPRIWKRFEGGATSRKCQL